MLVVFHHFGKLPEEITPHKILDSLCMGLEISHVIDKNEDQNIIDNIIY